MRLKTIAPVAAAAILLAACGNGVRENVKKLNDAEESLRLNPHNAEALIALLRHANGEIRLHAIWALKDLGRNALPAVDALEAYDIDELRSEAINAVGTIRSNTVGLMMLFRWWVFA